MFFSHSSLVFSSRIVFFLCSLLSSCLLHFLCLHLFPLSFSNLPPSPSGPFFFYCFGPVGGSSSTNPPMAAQHYQVTISSPRAPSDESVSLEVLPIQAWGPGRRHGRPNNRHDNFFSGDFLNGDSIRSCLVTKNHL
jgi:hypothetical protein